MSSSTRIFVDGFEVSFPTSIAARRLTLSVTAVPSHIHPTAGVDLASARTPTAAETHTVGSGLLGGITLRKDTPCQSLDHRIQGLLRGPRYEDRRSSRTGACPHEPIPSSYDYSKYSSQAPGTEYGFSLPRRPSLSIEEDRFACTPENRREAATRLQAREEYLRNFDSSNGTTLSPVLDLFGTAVQVAEIANNKIFVAILGDCGRRSKTGPRVRTGLSTSQVERNHGVMSMHSCSRCAGRMPAACSNHCVRTPAMKHSVLSEKQLIWQFLSNAMSQLCPTNQVLTSFARRVSPGVDFQEARGMRE